MKTHQIKFYCNHCDQPLKCGVEFSGRQVQCPSCKQLVPIPNAPSGSGFTQVEPESARPWDTRAWGG